MCAGCWEEYGAPSIDNPAVREAARAIAAVYEFSCVGGNLHVVIDDWNLDDENVEKCTAGIAENIHEAWPDQLEAEAYCLGILKMLTEDERARDPRRILARGGIRRAGAREGRGFLGDESDVAVRVLHGRLRVRVPGVPVVGEGDGQVSDHIKTEEIGWVADFAEERGYDDVARVLRVWADNPNVTAGYIVNCIEFAGRANHRFPARAAEGIEAGQAIYIGGDGLARAYRPRTESHTESPGNRTE